MPNYNCEMWHWGIPGMKWGQRRYQNKDGTWTSAGKVRRRGEEGNTRYATREEIDTKKKQVIQIQLFQYLLEFTQEELLHYKQEENYIELQ